MLGRPKGRVARLTLKLIADFDWRANIFGALTIGIKIN